MAVIRPFRALRYDPERVDVSRALAPPYDVIAADEREAYYARDAYNAIHLELTRRVEDERTTDYREIRETLDAWRDEGVLVVDARPSLYALRQHFTAPDGSRASRDGFFALLRLEDYAAGIVRRHERTLAGPKADRLKLLRASRANLSSVFMLYEDRDDSLARALDARFERPDVSARDEMGTEHRLVRIEEPERVAAVQAFLADRPLVIADGHHRYETALAYRDEQRAAGTRADSHEWLLVYLANAFAPGSLLLPIHRLIRKASPPADESWSERLPGWEQTSVAVPNAQAIPALLEEHLAPLADRPAFAADDASGTLRIFWWPDDAAGETALRRVHRDVIGGVFELGEEAIRDGAIEYPKSALRTAQDLRAGRGCVALYLNPLSPDDVFRVTAAGEVLPAKSTFFFPKLPSGLVFRTHDEGAVQSG